MSIDCQTYQEDLSEESAGVYWNIQVVPGTVVRPRETRGQNKHNQTHDLLASSRHPHEGCDVPIRYLVVVQVVLCVFSRIPTAGGHKEKQDVR